jgi:hypothetical protein
MRSSVKKFKQIYDDFGLIKSSMMLGITTYEIINFSKSSFGGEEAYTILFDLMMDDLLPRKYKEFELYYDDFSGTLYWEFEPNDLTLITVMATPFWEGLNEIPVDIQVTYWSNKEKSESFEDDFSEAIVLDDIRFENIEELLIWFRDFYLPKTYSLIRSTIYASPTSVSN